MVNKERIYDFLAGLNNDLDEVWGRLLGLKPLPPIEEVFSEVRREESRKRVMLGESKPSISIDNSALAARGPKTTNRGDTRNPQRRNLWCDHCQRMNHTRKTY